jgi:hypothetical protein
MDYQIINDTKKGEFYIPLNNTKARLVYKMRDSQTIDLIHTTVPGEYKGKSYAKDLVEFALNYARENNLKVIPTCPYVKSYLEKNSDAYQDIVIKASLD